MTFLSNRIIEVLYGRQSTDSAFVLSIHTLAYVFVCLGVISSQHLITENKHIIAIQRSFVGLVENMLLNLALILPYGFGVATAGTIGLQCIAPFVFGFIQQRNKRSFSNEIKINTHD